MDVRLRDLPIRVRVSIRVRVRVRVRVRRDVRLGDLRDPDDHFPGTETLLDVLQARLYAAADLGLGLGLRLGLGFRVGVRVRVRVRPDLDAFQPRHGELWGFTGVTRLADALRPKRRRPRVEEDLEG